ncbi:GNAT family N-acetyltransferase [Glaciecola sp. MH2013]|uniref:GNAT family N-acetyltransferase n=1 Tax=Glaciecola sp. MH2013 TaxID=2785524 RepID=UPI00189F52E7|nr:GNAT family N-acetyltransferase [Glaciecola sp. MH2013]MBF7072359.1 GNAT family N-acetyltransferase [Glaciecola sp. MH2013]
MMTHLSGFGVVLRPINEEDLSDLLRWRNREDIRSMMKSQSIISMDDHRRWFSSIVQLNNADIDSKAAQHCTSDSIAIQSQYFAICYKAELIGSANITTEALSLSKASEVEPGLYIGHERYRGNILAFAPSLVLNDYCFKELKVKRICATVHANNHQALAYNAKLGYKLSSSDEQDSQKSSHDHVAGSEKHPWIKMTLQEEDYLRATAKIRQFLSRPAKKN